MKLCQRNTFTEPHQLLSIIGEYPQANKEKTPKRGQNRRLGEFSGTPDAIRTHGLWSRKGFVATVYPLITASKVQFMTVFPRYIPRFSGEAGRQKQAADAKYGRQTSTSRCTFSYPITTEYAAEPEAAAPWSARYETLQGNPLRCWSQNNCRGL